VHTGDLKERDHLEDRKIIKIILKRIFKKFHGEAWTGFMQLRLWTFSKR